MNKRTKIILIVIGIIWLIFLLFLIGNICNILNAGATCIASNDCDNVVKSCSINFWIIGYLLFGLPSWILFLIAFLTKQEKIQK